MTYIDGAYAQLRSLGLTNSQNSFSEVFLGKSKRYYSFLLATGREPPLHVSISLALRLDALARRLAHTQGNMAVQLNALANLIRLEVERRSLLKVPCRRPAKPYSAMSN